jgi:hypothetical protein
VIDSAKAKLHAATARRDRHVMKPPKRTSGERMRGL